MIDTVKERKQFFQHLLMSIERKYAISTKEAIAMMRKEMQEATYTEVVS